MLACCLAGVVLETGGLEAGKLCQCLEYDEVVRDLRDSVTVGHLASLTLQSPPALPTTLNTTLTGEEYHYSDLVQCLVPGS